MFYFHTQEVKRIKSVPLLIGQFLEMIDDKYALVSSTSGSTYYARVLRFLFVSLQLVLIQRLQHKCTVYVHFPQYP